MKYNKVNVPSLKYSYLTPTGEQMTTFKGDQEKLDLFIKKIEEQNYALSSKLQVSEEHHILFFTPQEKVLVPA